MITRANHKIEKKRIKTEII